MTYLEHMIEVYVSVLYFKIRAVFYIDIVPYFIVINLHYLIFVLLGRYGVLSWSLASIVWDANHERGY